MDELPPDNSGKGLPWGTNQDQLNLMYPVSMRSNEYGMLNHLGPWNASSSSATRISISLPIWRHQRLHFDQLHPPEAHLLWHHPSNVTHRSCLWQWCQSSLWSNDTVAMYDTIGLSWHRRETNQDEVESSQADAIFCQDSLRTIIQLLPKNIPALRPWSTPRQLISVSNLVTQLIHPIWSYGQTVPYGCFPLSATSSQYRT
jgi:hypothetical protein